MTRKLCVIDAEGSRDDLRGVAFYSDRGSGYYTDHRTIDGYLREYAADGYTFVAHNAAYDLPVIFWTLDLPMRAIYYEGHFNRGEWRYDPKRPMALLWDSFNLSGNLSLHDLGEAIGLPKLATPASLTGEDRARYLWQCERHQTWECVECYAVRDAEIVYRYLETLKGTLDGWGVEMAGRIAANAQAVWRVLDRPEPIKLSDGRIRHLARKAYFGGRVETFQLGHLAPLHTADVQSMYPAAMRDALFPDPASMVYMQGLTPAQLPLELEGASEVTIYVPPSSIPPLPNSYAGNRVFGTGAQRGFWTHVELRYALSLGCRLLAVHQSTWSTHALTPFQTFVGGLWEMRCEYKRRGDPRAQTVKVLLNSAYGRLGLRAGLRMDIIEPWDPALTTADYAKKATKSRRAPDYGSDPQSWPDTSVYGEIINGKPFVRYGRGVPYEHTWVNVLWAATITAVARVKLHRLLSLQGDAAVYCDTDSIFSTAPIIGLGEGLGELSDHTAWSRGWIVGPKLYSLEAYDGTTLAKAKGVPRDKAMAFLRGEEVIFQSPVSPRRQRAGGAQAGEWIELHRQHGLTPHRRTPLDPALLETEHGHCRTIPHHWGAI